jgi:prepilin-type N-terminal cleavage/methylation domain-containing protein
MAKKQRNNFTLLEVMISLALLGVLLAFLFTFFRQTLTTKNDTCALKEKVMRLELFQLRLGNIFEHFSEEEGCFAASLTTADAIGSALVIHCSHGIDPDPSFSGPIHSMCFKTRDQRVCLCSWSKKGTAKVDTLLSGVKELSFEFFNGKQWQTLWPKDKKDPPFPHLIKISILLQGEEEKRQDFIFSLPPNAEIQYLV